MSIPKLNIGRPILSLSEAGGRPCNPPLLVDLDGTLIAMDTLRENINPLRHLLKLAVASCKVVKVIE